MAQGAYCSGCGRRVQLTASGECPQGHLRSMLRDVREGVEPDSRPDLASDPSQRGAVPGDPPRSHEMLSVVIGKAFVLIPVGAILAFGLWTGYEQAVGGGMSAGIAALVSVVSLVATVGLAFLWAAMRRKH